MVVALHKSQSSQSLTPMNYNLLFVGKEIDVFQKFTIQVLFTLSVVHRRRRVNSHPMPEGHHIRLNYSLNVAAVPPLRSCIIATSLL